MGPIQKGMRDFLKSNLNKISVQFFLQNRTPFLFAYLFLSFSASASVMAMPIFLKAAVISFVHSFPKKGKSAR